MGLHRARRPHRGAPDRSRRVNHRVASQLAFAAAHGLDYARDFLYPERVAAVTAAQVLALARRIFDPRRQMTGLVRAR